MFAFTLDIMSLTDQLPPKEQIAERIDACRQELAALKRLYRAARAAEQADNARQRRTSNPKEARNG